MGVLPKVSDLRIYSNPDLKFPPKKIWEKGSAATLDFLRDFVSDQAKQQMEGLNELKIDMGIILKKGVFSDVILQWNTKEVTKEFPLHKVVLYQRCEMMRKLINAKDSVIRLQLECSTQEMEQILEFIYTDWLSVFDLKNAQKLVKIGQELQLSKRFFDFCSSVLTSNSKEIAPTTLSTDLGAPFLHYLSTGEELTTFYNFKLIVPSSLSLEEGQIGTEQIPTHKFILYRCDYLRAMMTSGFSEYLSTESELKVKAFSEPVMIRILQFLYTDKLFVENTQEALEVCSFEISFIYSLLVVVGRCSLCNLSIFGL